MTWLLVGAFAYLTLGLFVLSLGHAAKAGDALIDRALRERQPRETER